MQNLPFSLKDSTTYLLVLGALLLMVSFTLFLVLLSPSSLGVRDAIFSLVSFFCLAIGTGIIILFFKLNSHEKKLKLETARFEASIHNLNVGFIVTDLDAEIITINPAAKRILCIAPNSLSPAILRNISATKQLNCSMADIEDQLKATFDIKSQIRKCIDEKKTVDIGEVPFKDLFLHVFITPIVLLEGKKNLQMKFIGTVILVEDVTQQKLLEQAKQDFFSIASHELRTPLTAIRGNTSLIKQFYPKLLEDKNLNEMVDDIHQSSIRLIGIVNDFLDMSRLEQGRMKFNNEAFDVPELITDAFKDVQSLVLEKKVSLQFTPPTEKTPLVFADKNRVRQVLLNLIGNALKFTQQGGITVSIQQISNPGNGALSFVKIFVADTGIGLSPQNQQRLFRKFQQASDNPLIRDASRGTGVGLYVSKLMIEGMGGTIKLESSTVGKGSLFSFTLPIYNQPQKKEEPLLQQGPLVLPEQNSVPMQANV